MKKKRKRGWDIEIIIKYLILILITPVLSILAYKARGYQAVGGEIFFVPLVLVLRVLIKTFKELVNC
ncbi:MAG: hypothetical protein Q4E50_06995 [Tissierellia bacterium]|nr:hypothetical protein [Tissierellia bacterium]